MKHTRISLSGWTAALGLLVAGGLLAAPIVAQTQASLNFRHVVDQQTSPTATSTAPQVITPELEADILEAHGEYQQAIAAYSKIRPQTAEIFNKIGIAYQRLAMDPEAIASYNRASQLDRKFAVVYNNLGTVYFHERDNKRARKLYKKSIKLNSEKAPFWSNLGAVYLAERQYSDAAEAYEKAFKLDPNIFDEIALNGLQHYESPEELAKMYLTFAEIYAHAGMKTEAIVYLRKAFNEGFHDRQLLRQDQQLATLHGDPQFELLVTDHHKL